MEQALADRVQEQVEVWVVAADVAAWAATGLAQDPAGPVFAQVAVQKHPIK